MKAIKRQLASGLSPIEIARDLEISRGTVYEAGGVVETLLDVEGQSDSEHRSAEAPRELYPYL